MPAAPWLLVVIDRTTGTPDYTLPDADASVGQVVVVKVLPGGAGSRVRAFRDQLIDGSPTFTLNAGEAAGFQARSGRWNVVIAPASGGGVPAHATTHQNGGSDEIDVTGLSGQLADRQLVRVQDEGATQGEVDTLDFVGAGVTAAVSLGKATVTIPGGAAGSLTLTEVTKDLGTARRTGTFDITGLAGLTIGKPVLITQLASPITSKGDARDEPEMDLITLTGYVVDANTIRAYWSCAGGHHVAVGSYNFGYAVGA